MKASATKQDNLNSIHESPNSCGKKKSIPTSCPDSHTKCCTRVCTDRNAQNTMVKRQEKVGAEWNVRLAYAKFISI